MAPNDLHEKDRLDLQHVAMREYFGTNCFAPIQHPKHILDAASGTGRWAREVAQQFSGAQVIGIDISAPLEIQEHGRPGEYTFQQVNILEPLPFPDESFDYTHMRFMFSAMPAQKWPEVVRELVRVTIKGGWIELVEAYFPTDGGPALEQLTAWWREIFAGRDIDMTLGNHVGEFLRAAGVVTVMQRDESLPMGPHGGRVGQIVGLEMLTGIRSGLPVVGQALGVAQQVLDETLRRIDADVYSGQYQARLPIFIAFGQR